MTFLDGRKVFVVAGYWKTQVPCWWSPDSVFRAVFNYGCRPLTRSSTVVYFWMVGKCLSKRDIGGHELHAGGHPTLLFVQFSTMDIDR